MTTHSAQPMPQPEGSAPAALPEPSTLRALWPTFLRRTLAEDATRPPIAPIAAN